MLCVVGDSSHQSLWLAAAAAVPDAQLQSRVNASLTLTRDDGSITLGIQEICQSFHCDENISPLLLDFLTHEISSIHDCISINQFLQSQAFCIANSFTPTCIDRAIFGSVYNAIKASDDAERFSFCNLSRWFDFMQQTPDIAKRRNLMPLITLKLNNPLNTLTDVNKHKNTTNKPKKKKKEKKIQTIVTPTTTAVQLDMVVGRVCNVHLHPHADNLYIEDIDVGNNIIKQVVSGLVKFVPLDKMKNRLVVLLQNVVPGNLCGVESHGVVLCASNDETTEPLDVPSNAALGERITFPGCDNKNPETLKGKKLHKLLKSLVTSTTGPPFAATADGFPFTTSAGEVNVPSISGGKIK